MKYAQVIDGTVQNVIVWDGTTELALEGELVKLEDQHAGEGWLYDGNTFVAPAPDQSPD